MSLYAILGIKNEFKMRIDVPAIMRDNETRTIDVAPYLNVKVGRTMAPVRFLSEALGLVVEWLPESRQVVLTDGWQKIVLTVDSPEALVNDRVVTMDCAPQLLAPGRVFAPLRFICETFGATVDYDAANQEITISNY